MLAWVKENPDHGLTYKMLGEKFNMAATSVGYYLRKNAGRAVTQREAHCAITGSATTEAATA